jgi:hypothetical protein
MWAHKKQLAAAQAADPLRQTWGRGREGEKRLTT